MSTSQQSSCSTKTVPSCCHEEQAADDSCHDTRRTDWLFRISLSLVVIFYLCFWLLDSAIQDLPLLPAMAGSVFELINTMWWGIVIGILMIGVLGKIPREFVMAALGTGTGLGGILRATAAGVLLDLCSHGILMVAAKLYERGASAGQVMAFLVASPWNSLSLTLVLIALVGLSWTLLFIFLSAVIAIVTGLIFDYLVSKNVLPANNARSDLPDDFRFWQEARRGISAASFNGPFLSAMMLDGLKDSRMVVRWILFGVLLASAVRTLMPPEHFETWFGPSLMGLALTVLAATIIEVCSEGSTPIAADLLNRAGAPGNGFAFLMTGVATDYTEVMVLRETTGSWRIALFLPLITVPQVLAFAWLMNSAAL
ncbi:MAG: permease [Gammaproteobacteria bacterium]|nr:permease [Gammaproteobacteria bacterium]